MSNKVIITKSKIDDLANSISIKSGVATPMTLTEMKTAVDSIPTGQSTATWTAVTSTVMGSFSGSVMSDGHLCVISNEPNASYADNAGEVLDDLPTEAMPIYFTVFDVSSSSILNMAIIDGLLHIENLEVFDPTEPIPAFTIAYPVAST